MPHGVAGEPAAVPVLPPAVFNVPGEPFRSAVGQARPATAGTGFDAHATSIDLTIVPRRLAVVPGFSNSNVEVTAAYS